MKIGIGVSPFNYWQSDDKTVDLFDPQCVGRGYVDGVKYDPNGWPTYIPPGRFSGWYLPATEGYTKPGRYRMAAKGKGRLLYGPPGFQSLFYDVDGSKNSGVVAEWDVKGTGRTLLGVFATDPGDPLRDVHLYRVDGPGPIQVFTPEYVTELKNFAALRLAGMPSVIGSAEADWPAGQVDYPKNPLDPAGTPMQWLRGLSLANKCKADAWINIPHRASDQYVREVAKLYRKLYWPGKKLYIEYSDEIWNWGYPFAVATQWVRDWAKANLGGDNLCYGYSHLSNHVQEVFSKEAPNVNVVRLFCGQHVWPDLVSQGLHYADTKGFRFDALGTAPYADPVGLDYAKLDGLWSDGSADAKEEALSRVFEGYDKSIVDLDRYAGIHKAMADKRGMDFVCYEMGPGWAIPGNTAPGLAGLYAAHVRDGRMHDFLLNKYYPWLAKYYSLAMYTQHTRAQSPTESWGIKSNADDVTCPKWTATMEWIARGAPA